MTKRKYYGIRWTLTRFLINFSKFTNRNTIYDFVITIHDHKHYYEKYGKY